MGYVFKRNVILKQKLLYTFLIICAYILGKELPLYMIDVSYYYQQQVETEMLLLKSISGDIHQCSIFALGISPYIMSSLINMIVNAFKKSEAKRKISPVKTNKRIIHLSLILAIFMAIMQVQDMHFRIADEMLIVAKTVAVIEMVAGAMLIIRMVSNNKKYGIGGQSALILVNITEGFIVTVKGYELKQLLLPLLICAVVMIVMLIMENGEKRIPVQRISIHNIYADKNYLAIKFSPIGVMPVMFSMAVFLLIRLLIELFLVFSPENGAALWCRDNVDMTKPFGILVYVVAIYLLAVGFSRVMINPGELSEQYLKNGDSIQNIRAGKETKKYLSKSITSLGFVSATVMSVCLSIPMYLQTKGILDSSLATLPTTVMMLTGIWSNLYREVVAVRDLEAYEPFI